MNESRPPQLSRCFPLFWGLAVGACSGGEGSRTVDADAEAASDATAPDAGAVLGRSCQDIGTSHEGCEFFAVDLPNSRITSDVDQKSADDTPFAVMIANPDAVEAAEAVVTIAPLGDEIEVARVTVEPLSTQVIVLPLANLGGTGVFALAFRIVASRPVTAYQFNPLHDSETAYSSDASLLLPVHALGSRYVAATADAALVATQSGVSDLGAFVAIVGVTDVPATVRVAVAAGIEGGDGIAPLARTVERQLRKYEVLNLRSLADGWFTPGSGNLSGTLVQADRPVAVFAGNVCAYVPHETAATACCCDHTEEQMLPLDSLGRSYVGAPPASPLGGAWPEDIWRITAGDEGVRLAWSRRPEGAPEELEPQQSVEFASDGPFGVESTGRVSLMQFLPSSTRAFAACDHDLDCGNGVDGNHCWAGRCELACNPALDGVDCPAPSSCVAASGAAFGGYCWALGDPSMITMPPIDQFRSNTVFLTPEAYERDFASLLAPAGTTVELDGESVEGWSPLAVVGGVEYEQVVVELLTDGMHVVEASDPVGVLVHGYDRGVSYGYPAGLDLDPLP